MNKLKLEKDIIINRNRLVHFYAQITPAELYQILHDDLGDFDVFLSAVKQVLTYPKRFNLEVE